MTDRPSPQLGNLATQQIANQLMARVAVALETMAAPAALLSSRPITASQTLNSSDIVILADATTGAVVPTLPAASTFGGAKLYIIVKTDGSANAVTVTPTAPDTISGAGTKVLAAQYNYASLISYSGGWLLLSP